MIGTSVLHPRARIVYGPFPGHNICYIPGKIVTALRIVSQIESAVPLIHGPIGCSWQRKFLNIVPGPIVYYTPCTAWTEFEVVYGGEGKLLSAIVELYHRFHPDMIVVLTTCASDMAGDDVASIVEEARKQVPAIIVYSTGLKAGKFRQVGAQDVLLSIAEQYVLPYVEEKNLDIIENSVNIQSTGVHGGSEVEELAEAIRGIGIRILKIYFQNVKVRDLLYMARSELNITPYRQLWADLVSTRRGIRQYYIGNYDEPDIEKAHPSGIEGFKKVFLEIGKHFDKEGEAEEYLKLLERKHEKELEKLRSALKDVKIAIDSYSANIGIVLAREFNVKISALIISTGRLFNFGLSKGAVKDLVEGTVNAVRRYSPDVEVIIDEPTSKICEKLSRLNIDLLIVNRGLAYSGRGFRVLTSRMLSIRARQHHILGYKATIEVAKTVHRAITKTLSPSDTRLVNFKEGTHIISIPEKWDKLALLFGLNRS